MKIGIPVYDGKLAAHFGHCEAFALIDVENGKVASAEQAVPPAHAPGVLPQWLAGRGCSLVIAGGMGARAQQLFSAAGIEVLCGAPSLPPAELVDLYVTGNLKTGDNLCDH